ncbi:MAG: DUF4982 domain-containing protein [Lachnospiraceae bacterium]|nr:DUF4982 domain-containing protein [Lachnospiraceae bacterium]
MRNINIDKEWKFGRGVYNLQKMFRDDGTEKIVNLPHDYMVESEVREDAPAGPASGYYTEGVAYYVKMLEIPEEWKEEKVFLHFDGVMMNATVELNGYKVALQHYGYVPFVVDLTPYVVFGAANRLLVTVNPSMQPNSRWYSGAGIFRSVELIHTPKVYLKSDGIFVYTDHIEFAADGTPEYAVLKAQIDIANETLENRIVSVDVVLNEEESGKEVLRRSTKIQINPGREETAQMTMILEHPLLWDDRTPNLYKVTAKVTDFGVFRTHMTENKEKISDENSVIFGVHTIKADAVHGLRVNGRTVKLKGGCLHHDNGLLGAVSLYDAEYRKLSLLKEVGFNAVRTTHNPPSPALIEACDRLGMYVFDEAFDCWGMGKQPGDYNMFFDSDWKKDLTAFVKRDRVHPSIAIWSTGNEIVERGGLNNGYTLATQLADTVRALDPSRPVSNGICSFWNGLDDELQMEGLKAFMALKSGDTSVQNADIEGGGDHSWEALTECFTNGLDIVGYNYMENKYPHSHELFPDRVILGSENYPKQIGIQWPMVESTPYVIGDFTWTAFDYIGEAGIGKAIFFDADDPILNGGPFALSSHTSVFPWRTANDADYDVTGVLLPQGAYRSVVWGSSNTYVFSYDPADFDRKELISMWGFTGVQKNWNWAGKEGKKVKVAVFSGAEEVELFLNGESVGVCKAGEAPVSDDPALPKSFLFETVYTPGELVAVSRTAGKEVSRDTLRTVGAPAALKLIPEKTEAVADGHALIYVRAEIQDAQGNVVPDAECALQAAVEGGAELLGFGSGNPVTAENYTSGSFHTYRGRALAIVRAGYESGEAVLKVCGEGIGEQAVTLTLK